MSNTDHRTVAERVASEFLPCARGPGRYIGGEVNQIKKDLSKCRLKVALCFPDIYEVGMSYTGMQVVYECLNRLPEVAAERVFAPWVDAEPILREKGIPLFSLESRLPLSAFDIVGFSLTNELCYTNVLNMLDLGGIPIRSEHRRETDPLVLGGGGISNCCEPAADFFDMFVLGDGEEAAVQLAEFVMERRRLGTPRSDILAEAARCFEWLYVPGLYRFKYSDESIASFQPLQPGPRTRLENAVVQDFENAVVPRRPIVPFVQAVHERVSVEIMRGCPGRCRFCQASFCRRPIRYRSPERIMDIAKAAHRTTGFDTVSLLSLSSADYPDLERLAATLHDYFAPRHVGLSLPSLRVDQQLKLLPGLLTEVRKGSITIAVEAAGERVRHIVNKPLKNEDLFAAVEAAYRAGWQRLKLYFMVGLPGETEQDIREIVELSFRLAKLRKAVDGKTGQINAAVSWFVPKPHTPFGWMAQKPRDYFENARRIMIDQIRERRAKFLQFKFHHVDRSILESAVGRGDRRLSAVIEAAWRAGARFDLWDECFDFGLWDAAFRKLGMDLDTAAQRQFAREEILPWQHLGGPQREYLLEHYDIALTQAAECH